MKMIAVLVAAGLVLAAGCGKKDEVPPPTNPVPTDPQQPTATQPTTATPAPAAPVALQTDPQAALAASEAALRARQYEEAAQQLLALQRQKQLTDAQAAAMRSHMVRLQSDVAAALASGDPKAKAAAEMLRNSTMR